ncbi:hypothetical protein OGAPHI_001119 [Ogataea philodendri]|uniref:Stress response protein NST1 n=1 Tax=Ogataea philodendri TaxID=1378263 RepID=A0A9P8PG32_9ASCO|nr:uncharacterized protein OGAPHI_001119 [Ogataea philodendri]KAH3670604.1 hypothetical protein OGAPHI_001119 [Ogataea philodendri]
MKVQVQLNNDQDEYPESRVIKIGENGDVVVSELSEADELDSHSHSEHSDEGYCHSCDHDDCSEHFEDYDEDYDECLHHQHAGPHKEVYWNNTLPSVDDREQVKQFWLGLGEKKRRELLTVGYDEIYKIVHQNPPGCNCQGCTEPKLAFERDLEKMYHAMYLTTNEDLGLNTALVHEMLGLDEPKPDKVSVADIDRVAEDILNNNANSFIDLVEQLDEERGARPEEEEEEVEEEDDEGDDDDDDEAESERERKQLHNAYRYLQVVIAKVISARLFAAYKEKVAEDSTKQLIAELEAEERRKKEKEEKEKRKKEKLKEKKRLQQLAKEEERRKREEDKLEQERIHQEEMRRKTEEGRKRKEEERRRREEEQRRKEEEKQRKKEERLRREEDKRREKLKEQAQEERKEEPKQVEAPKAVSAEPELAAETPLQYSAAQLSDLLSKLNIPVEKPVSEPFTDPLPVSASSQQPAPSLPDLSLPPLPSLDLFPDPITSFKQPFPSLSGSIWDPPTPQKSIWGSSSIWSKPAAVQLTPAQIEAVQLEALKATGTMVANNQCYPASLLHHYTRQAMLAAYGLDLTMDQFVSSLGAKLSSKLGFAFEVIYDELASPALIKLTTVPTGLGASTWNIGF